MSDRVRDTQELVRRTRVLAASCREHDMGYPGLLEELADAVELADAQVTALREAVQPLLDKREEQEREYTSGRDSYVQIGAVFFEDVEEVLRGALAFSDEGGT